MEKKLPTLTAVIIAKNEEERIRTCLSSVSWVNEIIVVDNDSTDATVSIARANGASVIPIRTENFSFLREIGIKNARSDWILYIDADEIVPDELKTEIQKTLYTRSHDDVTAYKIPRMNYYYGSHRWPHDDILERLFLRSEIIGWRGEVHESPVLSGKVGELKHAIVHHSHRTLEEMVNKTNEWSNIEAMLRYSNHHPKIVWWRFLRIMFTGFIDSYISQGGWKAGTIGIIEGVYQAFSLFITYAKLWELQHHHQKRTIGPT